MKLACAFALAAGVALSLTPLGAAKDLTEAQACGQSGCAALPRNADGDGLVQLRGSEGRPLAPPPKEAPYYRLNWEFGGPAEDAPGVRVSTLYVPSADLIAAPGMNPGSIEWFGASDAVLEKVRRAVRNLEPFAAPRQWPTTIDEPNPQAPVAPPPGASSTTSSRLRWLLPATAALFALAVGALVLRWPRARRTRRPDLGSA